MKRPLIILATVFTLLGTGLLIWFLSRGYWYEGFINPNIPIDLSKAGTFGDFVGGFIGTIFTIVGLFLLYETLSLQRKEFTESKRVFIKQQFDNTFFELIKVYRNIVDNISINTASGQLLGISFYDNNMTGLQNNFITQRALSYNRKTAVRDYQNFYVQYKNITTVYFKTLYRIYALIDDSELHSEDKRTYSKILRAQLTDSELFFIRYNAMTEHGRKSAEYINKYNILKHLSHFELLEFKDWWSKLTAFERNGLDYLFKEFKEVIKLLIEEKNIDIAERKYKADRYAVSLQSENSSTFSITIKRDTSKNSTQQSLVDGFDKFNDQEIENLLECIIKELVISSNFNNYNNRRELEFFSDTVVNATISTITAGVKNKNDKPIRLSYDHSQEK
jgi:hypothetical protein